MHSSPSVRRSIFSIGSPLAFALMLSAVNLSGCGGDEFTSTNASGGSLATGGSSSSTGGTTASGGAVSCSDGDLTFRLTTSLPERNCAPSAECGASWITLLAEGSETPIQTNSDCSIECSSCELPSCPDIACLSVPFRDELAFRWQGEVLQEGTCGGGSSCDEVQCAAPGQYVARICLDRAEAGRNTDSQCFPSGTVECFDYPFSWPTRGEAQLTIGDTP